MYLCQLKNKIAIEFYGRLVYGFILYLRGLDNQDFEYKTTAFIENNAKRI